MNINDYLKAPGSGTKLARAIGVNQVMISQWRMGKKKVPFIRCVAIEKATDGAVRCEDLRPDIDWGYLRNAPVKEAA